MYPSTYSNLENIAFGCIARPVSTEAGVRFLSSNNLKHALRDTDTVNIYISGEGHSHKPLPAGLGLIIHIQSLITLNFTPVHTNYVIYA